MNYNIEGLRLLDILYLGRHSTEVRNDLAKSFKIYHIYGIQKPMYYFPLFHANLSFSQRNALFYIQNRARHLSGKIMK